MLFGQRSVFAGLALLLVVACARGVAPEAVNLPTAPTSAVDATGPSALAQRAEACFADPSCPLARASDEFVAADARGADVDCFRFYHGVGVAPDAARARACFARAVRRDACDGSPDLPHLYLATLQMEGQGGPADAAGATATLAGCGADIGVEGVRGLHPGGHTDFCDDIGGTTLAMSDCAQLRHARMTFAFQAWRKSVDARMTPASRAGLASADAAFARYVEADAAREADAFRGGSLSGLTWAGARSELVEARARALGDAARPVATEADAAQREVELGKATAAARSALDTEGASLLATSDTAFHAYLDAEVAAAVQRGEAPAPLRAELLRDRATRLR